MEREQYIEVIEDFLASGVDGVLFMDTSNNLVDWHMNESELQHDDFKVLVHRSSPVKCDCGEYYTKGCKDCEVIVNAMLNTVNHFSTK